jgi:hypothetical protein
MVALVEKRQQPERLEVAVLVGTLEMAVLVAAQMAFLALAPVVVVLVVKVVQVLNLVVVVLVFTDKAHLERLMHKAAAAGQVEVILMLIQEAGRLAALAVKVGVVALALFA